MAQGAKQKQNDKTRANVKILDPPILLLQMAFSLFGDLYLRFAATLRFQNTIGERYATAAFAWS